MIRLILFFILYTSSIFNLRLTSGSQNVPRPLAVPVALAVTVACQWESVFIVFAAGGLLQTAPVYHV